MASGRKHSSMKPIEIPVKYKISWRATVANWLLVASGYLLKNAVWVKVADQDKEYLKFKITVENEETH